MVRWFYQIGVLGLVLALGLLAFRSPVGETGPAKPPPAPENVRVRAVDQGLEISWKCVPESTHHTLFWGFERGDYRNLANTDACSAIIEGLKKGELYYFAVSSWNASGESGYSREQAFLYDDEPERAGVYLSKGSESMSQGLFAEAHAYLSAAIRLDPENPEAYRQRARLHEKLNQTEFASQDYQMAEKIFKKKPLSIAPSNQ